MTQTNDAVEQTREAAYRKFCEMVGRHRPDPNQRITFYEGFEAGERAGAASVSRREAAVLADLENTDGK